MRLKMLLLVPLVLGLATAQNLLKNGDFEDSLKFWTQEQNNAQGEYEISRNTNHQPDADYEVYVYKYLQFYARIKQTVDIPSCTDVRFHASARLLASTGGTTGYYAYATVSLDYLNSSGTALGRTMIVKVAGDTSFPNTSL